MIKVLDSYIADKIAAGEVIERPVSIVKELVENSVDAGSTSIIVEIRNGGKSYIRVTDNGCGIPADEVETAFLRHATSKISSMRDLESIETLGFRGEALASISAVSRLTIVTRTAESPAGTKVCLHGGRTISNEIVGTNVGTTIVVEDVFYNTPARRKFMGSDAREASAIIELIEHYAIYYANVRFMLINNGSTIFTTNGDDNILSAIKSVYPTKEYDNLIEINNDTVSGYISDPGTTKSSRRGQLFFVNGRLVNSEVIQKGIQKGYGDRIFSGFPIAILFIQTDPSTVDVNIHPGKREIKFLHKDEIIGAVSDAIDTAMQSKESVPAAFGHDEDALASKVETSSPETLSESSDSVESNHTASIFKESETTYTAKSEPLDIRSYLANIRRYDESEPKEVLEIEENREQVTPRHEEIQPQKTAPEKEEACFGNDDIESNEDVVKNEAPVVMIEPPKTRPFSFKDLQICGYFFNSYIVLQARDELFFLDQHAAHERIFYEKLVNNYANRDKLPQPILTPITITVSADVYSGERSWLNSLTKIGYDISDFGANTFIIRGIPAFMNLKEAEEFARNYMEEAQGPMDNSTVVNKLITKSCKSAVKANDKLSAVEISELVKTLSGCTNPFCCPHGRPTFIKLTKYEIERAFRRK